MSNNAFTDCQSCGMPLSMDEKGGGTNADGSKSQTYCSHCYQSGTFVLPDLSLDDMRKRVEAKLREVGVPMEIARSQVAKVPGLLRWK